MEGLTNATEKKNCLSAKIYKTYRKMWRKWFKLKIDHRNHFLSVALNVCPTSVLDSLAVGRLGLVVNNQVQKYLQIITSVAFAAEWVPPTDSYDKLLNYWNDEQSKFQTSKANFTKRYFSLSELST